MRMMGKQTAPLGEWMNACARSTELRRWYRLDLSRYQKFRVRFRRKPKRERGGAAAEYLMAIVRERPFILWRVTKQPKLGDAPMGRRHGVAVP